MAAYLFSIRYSFLDIDNEPGVDLVIYKSGMLLALHCIFGAGLEMNYLRDTNERANRL